MSFSCVLASTNVNIGDAVSVIVGVTGNIGFESDFNQMSFQATSDGSTPIAVGPVNGPGFYTLRVVNGTDSVVIGVIAVPTSSGASSLVLNNKAGSPPGESDATSAIHNFLQSVTPDILAAAGQKIIGPWSLDHAASLGSEVVLCGAFVSGVAVFGGSCYDNSVDALSDFAVSLLIEAVSEMKTNGQLVPPGDADLLIQILTDMNTVLNLTSGSNDLELVLNSLSTLSDQVVENDALKMTIHFGIEEAKKANLLIELLKK
jgi:hypothetical protein